MNEFQTLEAVPDPNNRMTFLLDWELTMKCNLNCSYCPEGLYSGHLNSTSHPKLADCLPTIDFMYRYVDQYMQSKKKSLRHVVLNIYGGEALFHKDIVEICQQAKEKYQVYKNNWHLTISTTTNLTISAKKLEQLMESIDEWTCSFHSESTEKQKERFRSNLLKLKAAGKSCKVIVLMHSDPNRFIESQDLISWCKENNIRYLPRQIDHHFNEDFEYNKQQVVWFNNLYNQKNKNIKFDIVKNNEEKYDLADVGRSCCGGRLFCTDRNYKSQVSFVNNKFPGWKCSVNHFFLYVKQITGEVFNNKDCKTNLNSTLGPLGYLSDTDTIIKQAKQFIELGSESGITCVKNKCMCGLCSPKAENLNLYKQVFGKYLNETT